MLNTLSNIGEKLNQSNIVWGVGASVLLHQYGLVKQPRDIDIFVDLNDIERADEILKSIGEKKSRMKTDTYATTYFYEYLVDEIEVDVMAGFAVNHNSGVFEYTFDRDSIAEIRVINGVGIPFTSIEDWYVLYQLIPGRQLKADMIEKYLLSEGIKQPYLLARALEGNLPIEVRARVEMLLIS